MRKGTTMEENRQRAVLAPPEAGWSELHIGDWSDRVSYLDDVPMILLKAFRDYYDRNVHTTPAVTFDAEGWEFTVVFNPGTVHIIEMKDEAELTTIEVNMAALATQLANDILENLDGWTNWMEYSNSTPYDLALRKETLKNFCNGLIEKAQKIRR